MKLFAYLIFISLLFTGCLDESPNRPTYTLQNTSSDTDDTDGDTDDFEIPTRPDGAVYLQSGFCGCKDGEAITVGNCASVCQGKTATVETLFVDVKVGEEIDTSSLKDFYGWCTDSITYEDPETGEIVEDGITASCSVQVKDENGSLGSLNFEPKAGSNSFSVDITALDYDKTYRLSVVENSSGASSTTIQVRKYSSRISDPKGGPLDLMSVNQFTCLNRTVSTDDTNGDNYYESATRSHYYFIAEDRPEPLSESYANLFCHDYRIYGTTPINNPLLEETPKSFWVWDKWDPRFYDLDGAEVNGTTVEIHKILGQRIRDLGYEQDEDPEVFFPLEYYNGPPVSEDGSTPAKKQLGYYMLPFVDEDNGFKAYCPTAAHYNSDNPLFQAMKEVVGTDTEGLYIAKQSGVCDVILVGETLLKKIWFYTEDGKNIQPNDETVKGKQIQFYWPADTTSPMVKKSHQKLYILKRATDSLCGETNVSDNQNTSSSQYPSHDKRIGCVPAP